MSDQLIRDYQTSSEIGRGRFGVVYKAFNKNGDVFAVKSIDKRRLVSADDSLDSQCLLTEPKILLLVSPHPNVISLHGIYEDEDDLHMVLDLCDASDLFRRVRLRVFAEPKAATVMWQLMHAVAHCHRLGVAHRDIKPDNVLFDGWDWVRLADFGSAETFGEGEMMRGVVGTPYYVAPEVLTGKEYGETVDVWSAGVVLYVTLADFPPFHDEFSA